MSDARQRHLQMLGKVEAAMPVIADHIKIRVDANIVTDDDQYDSVTEEGVYPKYRYEMVDNRTGEVVASSTKRGKCDEKVGDVVKKQMADLSPFSYYMLTQEEEQGEWTAAVIAEGKRLRKYINSFSWQEYKSYEIMSEEQMYMEYGCF